MRLYLVLSLIIFLLTGPAFANLPDRVETALQKLEAANKSVPRFAFERQTYKKNVKVEVKYFDPGLDIPGNWQVLFPSKEQDRSQHEKLQKKYESWDGNSDKVMVIPDLRKRMKNGVKLIGNADGMEIYEFDIADEYILEGGGRSSDIREHIKGEVHIDTSTNDIRKIRYYSPHKFKPISVVSLSEYEIVQHVGPAWQGGPIVRLYETSKVRGSAVIKKIDVDEIMINQKFKPLPTQ